MADDYSASDITVYEKLDAVRANLNVYLSETDSEGIFKCVREPIVNVFDEWRNGHGKTVFVIVDKGSIWVCDAARGIPVEKHPVTKESTLTTVLTRLSAGGKMKKDGAYGKKATAGCFVYDTKIELLSGKKIAIGKLADRYTKKGKRFWVYSHNPNGDYQFQPALASAFPTKIVEQLAVVTLDNGAVIRCTVDHPFYDVNFKEVRADQLKPFQSLMSMNIEEDKDGYLCYRDNVVGGKNRVRVNRAVADMTGQDIIDHDVHHIGHKRDNRPHMLQALDRWTHMRIDTRRNKKLAMRAKGVKNVTLGKNNRLDATKLAQQDGKILRIFVRILHEGRTINATTYTGYRLHSAPAWNCIKPEHIAQLTRLAQSVIAQGWIFARNGRKHTIAEYVDYSTGAAKSMHHDQTEDMKLKRNQGKVLRVISAVLADGHDLTRESYEYFRHQLGTTYPKYDKIDVYFQTFNRQELLDQARAYNHKVVSVEIVKVKPTQVYALTVEPNHNYLLGAGVFVKNTHGMGVAITNAASKMFQAWVIRNGKCYTQTFAKGKEQSAVILSKPPVLPFVNVTPKCGTTVRFVPDLSLFDPGSTLDMARLREFLDLSAYTHAGLKIILVTPKGQTIYHQPGGLKAYLEKLVTAAEGTPLSKPFFFQNEQVEVAMQWINSDQEQANALTNSTPTKEGGTHVNGLTKAISEALEPYAAKRAKYKPEDLRGGLVYFLNAEVFNPKFTTQVKDKLRTPEAAGMVYDALVEPLKAFFEKNKSVAKEITKRADGFAKVTADAADRKRSVAGLKSTGRNKLLLPDKLSKSTTKDPTRRWLYPVEGDSAAGEAVKARDSDFQEILRMRGKILNVFTAKDADIYANEEVKSFLQAVGYDPTVAEQTYRVGRVIIMADEDVDGNHISVLILSVILKKVPDMITKGMVYVLRGYLYTGVDRKGKRYYADTLDDLRKQSNALVANTVTRMKGWGEAEAAWLEDIAFGENAKLLQVIPSPKPDLDNYVKLVSSGDDGVARRFALLTQKPVVVNNRPITSVTIKGIRMPFAEAVKKYGRVPGTVIAQRLRSGWPLQKAFQAPEA